MIDRARIKAATIPEYAAIQVIRDIDSAIERRSIAEIRAFAREAELSGMDQEASRAREFAALLESKAGAEGRAELMRIKAALEPRQPSQADLVRRYDSEQLAAAMSRGRPFRVNDFEREDAELAEAQNANLARARRRAEEQRAAQVAAAAEPKGPRRR